MCDYTISPATRRLWTAALLALLTLLFVSAPSASAQTAVAVVTDPDGVNLRGGPGREFQSLTVIPKGAELPIIGARLNGSWLPVSYQGRIGFVHDDFVDVKVVLAQSIPGAVTPPAVQPAFAPAQIAPTLPQPSPSPVPSPSPGATPQQLRVSSPDGVNLRLGPGTDQRVLTVLPVNTRVTVLNRSADGRWVHVSTGALTGWVDGQYLSSAEDRPNLPGFNSSQAPDFAGGSRFIWPVANRSITTYFGPSHPGIDVDEFPNGGNPVWASAAGKVIFAGGNACCSYGLNVRVQHGDGSMTLYAHLSSIDVREGQDVSQGQVLGKTGNTGFSTGAHLHYELHINNAPADPLAHLPRGGVGSTLAGPAVSPFVTPPPSPVPSSGPPAPFGSPNPGR
jgi:murein DD-endopeptidase MepM/ murein hydrolase activator NlpD